MPEPVIQTDGLTCYYGSQCAVRDLQLEVPQGCVLGFLGRNGAGKTTTIRMLLGLLKPTRGTSALLGYDSGLIPRDGRARIGYLAEGHPTFRRMRVAEAGVFEASFYERWSQKIFDGVIDHFGIAKRTKSRHLSRGQRAGLALALTLATQPELLILDDPSRGLDPVARTALLEAMIYFARHEERTILLSSHDLSGVERVADRIAVIDDGILRVDCAVDAFQERVRKVILSHQSEPTIPSDIPGLLSTVRSQDRTVLTIANLTDDTRSRLRALKVDTVDETDANLEEAVSGYMEQRREKTFFLSELGGAS